MQWRTYCLLTLCSEKESAKDVKRKSEKEAVLVMEQYIRPRSFPSLPSLPDEALTDFLATVFIPFYVASNPSFINLVEVIQRTPKWRVPHRYTLSTSGVDDLWRDVVSSVKDVVGKCSTIGATTDGWSGPKAMGYWALTANGITDDFQWVNTPLSDANT